MVTVQPHLERASLGRLRDVARLGEKQPNSPCRPAGQILDVPRSDPAEQVAIVPLHQGAHDPVRQGDTADLKRRAEGGRASLARSHSPSRPGSHSTRPGANVTMASTSSSGIRNGATPRKTSATEMPVTELST